MERERKMEWREEEMVGRRNGGGKGRREINKKRLRSMQILCLIYYLFCPTKNHQNKRFAGLAVTEITWGASIMNTQFSAQND